MVIRSESQQLVTGDRVEICLEPQVRDDLRTILCLTFNISGKQQLHRESLWCPMCPRQKDMRCKIGYSLQTAPDL